MSKQTAIRLPDETYERLKALSERTGRTSAYYIREAIEKHIEDMEDLYLAEEATLRHIANKERTHTLEEVMRDLDLAIEFRESARKELKKLNKQDATQIVAFLSDRIAADTNPRRTGQALQGSELGNFWRYRVGDYSIICDIQDNRLVVLVIEIGHRREVYR